jgi:hypothetical protein
VLAVAATAWALPVPQEIDPLHILPNNYRLVFENEWVRVVRIHYGPHEKLPVHSHSQWATVYVYLSDSPAVQFRHIEKPAFTLTRPRQKAGAFRVSPGRIEVHEVENMGDRASDFLRIELKQIPLGVKNLFQRGAAPADLSVTRVAEEYVRPQLVIERAIVANHHAVNLDDAAIPSLVIAFSEVRLPTETIPAGGVHWLKPGVPIRVDNVDSSSAHLLRIKFPQAR